MFKYYADYNFEENSTTPIDYMQTTLQCCGLRVGWGDWNKTSGYAEEWIKTHTVDTPDSCCVKGQISTHCGFGQATPLADEDDRIVYTEVSLPSRALFTPSLTPHPPNSPSASPIPSPSLADEDDRIVYTESSRGSSPKRGGSSPKRSHLQFGIEDTSHSGRFVWYASRANKGGVTSLPNLQ
eukprot:sb/3471599/